MAWATKPTSESSSSITRTLSSGFLFGKNLLSSFALIGAYAGHATAGRLKIRDRNERLTFFSENIGHYTKRVLKNFHFDLQVIGYDADLMKKKNFLIVANHISYLDILLLSSVQPVVFVTSVDLGETKFLGTMAELGGSIFVERRNRSHISRDRGVIADTLRAGHDVVIFPEGTSTSGETILPFKKSLLTAAVEAGVDIMPLVIKYTHIDGEPLTKKSRDRVAWYGDMTFLSHFLGLMTARSLRAELHFLPPIPVTPESSRHELADKAYAAIRETYER